MIKVLLLSVVLVAVVFVLMAISILIKKNGKFPNLHIGSNKEMRKRGISCATSQHREAQKDSIKIKPLHLEGEGDSQTLSC
ncbi:hypothetical protein [Plebeiibacterium marinum]|uniref:Uncharacterized protein n=1 Tax=Plebeiibacterium marinum TaxID=2992111 RepID=A0AAE3SJ31_9BACT|nr:hypothetical protein [Plebeiobacterium marinum]MCW3804999.1 hypothetical protein [Plebeiobacterium marinum]